MQLVPKSDTVTLRDATAAAAKPRPSTTRMPARGAAAAQPRRSVPANSYFDDLDEDRDGGRGAADAAAAARAAAQRRASVGPNATARQGTVAAARGRGADLLRRVLLQYPSGTVLPDTRDVADSLRRYGVSRDDVGSDWTKCAL
eukprot:364309-Chlamydomonas_euryale.AAC.2